MQAAAAAAAANHTLYEFPLRVQTLHYALAHATQRLLIVSRQHTAAPRICARVISKTSWYAPPLYRNISRQLLETPTQNSACTRARSLHVPHNIWTGDSDKLIIMKSWSIFYTLWRPSAVHKRNHTCRVLHKNTFYYMLYMYTLFQN